jgi:hypothetical protein
VPHRGGSTIYAWARRELEDWLYLALLLTTALFLLFSEDFWTLFPW